MTVILNIFHNFTHIYIICSDKDPPWFNDEIRQFLNKKNELFKQSHNNGKLQINYNELKCIRSDLVESIWSSKETLREKCQNTEFFLVRIFPHSH